jgi:O-antigen ligase
VLGKCSIIVALLEESLLHRMHVEKYTKATLSFNEKSGKEKIFSILTYSVPVLMGIFLFFNPFPHTTAIKEICFYFSVVIVLVLIIFKKIDFSFKSPMTVPFTLFIVWTFIGLFFALDKENSIHDFYAHLLKYIAIYYILINFFNTHKRLVILSWIVIISTTVFSIGAIVYFYLILNNPLSTRLGTVFLEIHVDLIGFATLFAMILSLYNFHTVTSIYHKSILIVALTVTSMATLLTQSRATLLAAIFAFIVLFLRKKKTMVAFTLIFVIGAGFIPGLKNRLDLDSFFHNARIGIWLTSVEVIKFYPVTGIGFGMQTYGNKTFVELEKYNTRVPSQYRQKKIIVSPHNTLIDVAVRTGLVGLILYCFILFSCARMGWMVMRLRDSHAAVDGGMYLLAAFLGVFIQGLFSDGTFGPQVIVLYTIFAMMTILWRISLQNDGPGERRHET